MYIWLTLAKRKLAVLPVATCLASKTEPLFNLTGRGWRVLANSCCTRRMLSSPGKLRLGVPAAASNRVVVLSRFERALSGVSCSHTADARLLTTKRESSSAGRVPPAQQLCCCSTTAACKGKHWFVRVCPSKHPGRSGLAHQPARRGQNQGRRWDASIGSRVIEVTWRA